ncbi:MAG TPA: hypothetical protein VHW71_11390 [Steroidobacteraceae bacterium]|nr:hypothetical protein [Steroidobacteraceae bacterium]
MEGIVAGRQLPAWPTLGLQNGHSLLHPAVTGRRTNRQFSAIISSTSVPFVARISFPSGQRISR